ncbi:MAG TPA: metal ABC transporter permease, partial [Planctomycetota bacterium]|nr:metal ABC transporter permease [Planctomycetota bacterium]
MSQLLDHVRTLYWPTLQVSWPSVLAAAAMAVAGGILGVFMVLRREAMVALCMPQVVTLGAALGLRLGWPTLSTAVGTVGAALALMALSRRREGTLLLLPSLYIAGVTLSILLVAGAGAHLVEVQNLFTGIDVAVAPGQALFVAAVLLAVAACCAVLWRRWLLVAQAPATAEVAGVRPRRWNGLYLCLLATVLVLATNTVGTVLVIAMLFLPAATVLPWAPRI